MRIMDIKDLVTPRTPLAHAALERLAQMRGHARAAGNTQASDPRTWYKISNSVTSGEVDVLLYDEIGYWGVTAQDFATELGALAGVTQINLRVNSPGGDVFDGLAIYNTLKRHPANVTAYVDGMAASAASFIVQAADKIVADRNCMVMIHDASGLCWGNATEMSAMAALLDQISDNIADIYAQRAGGTVADWRTTMRGEQWYTGTEAVAAGLADETGEPDPDEGDPSNPADRARLHAKHDLSTFIYAGRDKAPAPGSATETRREEDRAPDTLLPAVLSLGRGDVATIGTVGTTLHVGGGDGTTGTTSGVGLKLSERDTP